MKKLCNTESLPPLSKERDSLNKLIIEGEKDAKKALEIASTLRGKPYFHRKKPVFSSRGK